MSNHIITPQQRIVFIRRGHKVLQIRLFLNLYDMASSEDLTDEEAFVEDEPNPNFEEPQNDQVFIQGKNQNKISLRIGSKIIYAVP